MRHPGRLRRPRAEAILEITLYHSSFGQRYPEYRVDLTRGEWWSFYPEGLDGGYVPRDPAAADMGYRFAGHLDTGDIADFISACDRAKLLSWKARYDNEEVMDGHQWGMVILLEDGTERTVDGSNRYPKGWDLMRQAFIDLTGEDLLIYDSDWLEKQ